MKYRAEIGVIDISRNAVVFLAAVLSLAYLVNDFDIVWNNKFPVTETLTEHFFSFPAEESLRCGRPAEHAEFVVPFDDRERCVLDVKGETSMVVGRCCFCEFAISHVAHDGDPTDHFAILVVTGRVVTVKETVTTRLSDHIRTILGDDAFTGERVEVVFVFSGFLQAWKQVESVIAEHVLTLHSRDALHGAIPGRVTALAIECEDAINVRLEQAF